MNVSIITKRERKTMRRIATDFPYLAPLFDRVLAVADQEDATLAGALRLKDEAERRERDIAREMAALRRRIAELESRP